MASIDSNLQHDNGRRFARHFPDDCPPPAAIDVEGTVFRFAKNDPVNPEDFLSHYELGLAPTAPPCRRVGLSVYRTLAAARRKLQELRDRSPDRYGRFIAEGTLDARCGKIKQEGKDPDHHEWWPYDGIEAHAPFRIVCELDR
jgi:hypothetical protein